MKKINMKQAYRPLWKAILIGAIMLGSVAGNGGGIVHAAGNQSDFQDTRTSYAREAIDRLVNQGIVAGTTEHSFEPKKAVTRAEFASFAVRLLALKPVKNSMNPYADVSAKAWYYGNVATMTNLSILEEGPASVSTECIHHSRRGSGTARANAQAASRRNE